MNLTYNFVNNQELNSYYINKKNLKFTKNDFNLVFELDGNSEVMQYITLGKTKTIEQIRNESLPKILKSYSNGKNYGIFAAYLKSNNSFIGWFQF